MGGDRRGNAVKASIVGMGEKVNRHTAGYTARRAGIFRVRYRCAMSVSMACDRVQVQYLFGYAVDCSQYSQRFGQGQLCHMRVLLCPAIGDGISLFLSGNGNQSLCIWLCVGTCPRRIKGVGCLSPGKSPWTDDGMMPKQTKIDR